MNLKIKRLTKTAKLPEKNNPTDAGFDVFTDEEILVQAGQTLPISTGIAIAIPKGYYGRLTGRSGLTVNTALRIQEGTIDSDYRGEVKIIAETKAFEFTPNCPIECQTNVVNNFKVEKGMKIAQLIIQPLPDISIVEADELEETDRGGNGFGSSGI